MAGVVKQAGGAYEDGAIDQFVDRLAAYVRRELVERLTADPTWSGKVGCDVEVRHGTVNAEVQHHVVTRLHLPSTPSPRVGRIGK